MAEDFGLHDVTVQLGSKLALDHVTLTVPRGAVVGIVGGDGAGKTTLLRTLCGRIRPSSGRVVAPARSQIGFQPATSGTWANLSVLENLQLVAGSYRLGRAPRTRIDELVEVAGLTSALRRPASKLSGGMRQKLGFCMAILSEPELLVLDEPSTGVDPVSRVELWALIADAAARGTSVAMATTYVDEAARAQHVLVLDEGLALLSGTPSEVLAAAPGAVVEVDAADEPDLAWRRGRRTHQWRPDGAREGERLVTPDMEDTVIAAQLAHRGGGEPPLPASVRTSGPTGRRTSLVRADRVSCAFGEHLAVDDVSLDVGPGEVVGLIGANGAGKTTLIRMLLGLIHPSAGEVEVFGAPPSREARRRVGYVPQGLGLYRDLSVDENLDFAAAAQGNQRERHPQLESVSRDLVGDVGLGHQRITAFAAALDHSPELLVLDEPTSGVDPVSRARLWDTIHAEAEAGAGLLVSTHYMQEAEQCDRLVLMDLGRVVAHGTVDRIIGDTRVIRVTSQRWADAFNALRASDLPVSLDGIDVRVVDTPLDRVRDALAAAEVEARLDEVPATLDETMTAIVRARGGQP